MTTLKSYDLNGKKLSFANWISNLSPQDVPFTSMTGKESINQTMFQWQTDSLIKAGDNAQMEGEVAKELLMKTTSVKQNITQILRKVVKVSDTANALANYGRGRELQYQMEKAGKEIKRDLEYAFLQNVGSQPETATGGRETAGFRGLVAAMGTPCPETGAIVHTETKVLDATGGASALTEKALFGLTYNLYLAGAKANIIMFHPEYASFFSSLQEKGNTNRERIFENTPRFSVHVSTIVDPLGQEYKLIPNRWMPRGVVYFFQPSDWTQMVLRAPERTKLAKDGSYEKWMMEMEVGLRHRHPYASGVLHISTDAVTSNPHSVDNTNIFDGTNKTVSFKLGATDGAEADVSSRGFDQGMKAGGHIGLKGFKTAAGKGSGRVSVLCNGKEVWGEAIASGSIFDCSGSGANGERVIVPVVDMSHGGIYSVEINLAGTDGSQHIYNSYGLGLNVAIDITETGGVVTGPISSEEESKPVARKARAKKVK